MKTNNRDIKKYYRNIRRKLPNVPKEKKNYLTMLRKSVECYLIECPSATIEDIHGEFGTVEQICEEFKDSISPKQLMKSVRRTKVLCRCLSVLAVALIAFAIYFTYEIYTSAPADVQITIELIDQTEHTED
jgi:hypothetical protein